MQVKSAGVAYKPGLQATLYPSELISKDLKRDLCMPPEQKQICVLRSESLKFDFKDHCLFCGRLAKYTEGTRRGYDVHPVRTTDFPKSIFKHSQNRTDEWPDVVAGRLAYGSDLHAADAIYHQSCNVNFRTGKQIPQQFCSGDGAKRLKQGRPEEQERLEAFLKAASYVEENDDEQITISDLINKMGAYLQGTTSTPYGQTHMEIKLKEHFGNDIVITELKWKSNVVTFRTTVESVLYSFYEQKTIADSEKEGTRIVLAAAKLIRSDIKAVEVCNKFCPTEKQMEDSEEALKFLPSLLLSSYDDWQEH